ncbi:hypothetical protein PAE0228 [Pyrobaculum aerophilum str. IM2]|uniref:Uncharacterized protein n=1 Tax=Pyrobaculum aerophilum (strain ATCC 51768 / DSM 7523 / JCM 9630 / CIP 104966 / NBRC 100827 / IM2) TaxID=178306 RepID=Q8ZZJ4_PYRAE|nr:hypothetical protein PAE0228 [Pyrobaculum aerophilum str. IM2]
MGRVNITAVSVEEAATRAGEALRLICGADVMMDGPSP